MALFAAALRAVFLAADFFTGFFFAAGLRAVFLAALFFTAFFTAFFPALFFAALFFAAVFFADFLVVAFTMFNIPFADLADRIQSPARSMHRVPLLTVCARGVASQIPQTSANYASAARSKRLAGAQSLKQLRRNLPDAAIICEQAQTDAPTMHIRSECARDADMN
ncbi:MAG: hypothetical protein L0Y57_07385 [Beijerinckiaceae bacterium]|nr:hypothetical protein [Beijerinckiaceae bacterium]